MKVVINKCYGGFGLSKEATELIAKEKGVQLGKWNDSFKFYEGFGEYDIPRNDPVLINVVETLGEAADGSCAELRVVEIPEGVEWEIGEYDGIEWVAEKHRTWS